MLAVSFVVAAARPQEESRHGIVPEQDVVGRVGTKKVWGDSEKPGVPSVIRTQVRGEHGNGIVVGALCSPGNQLTQYWVQETSGERFWTTLEELRTQ